MSLNREFVNALKVGYELYIESTSNYGYNLYFTHDNETLRSIFKINWEDILREFNFTSNFSSS